MAIDRRKFLLSAAGAAAIAAVSGIAIAAGPTGPTGPPAPGTYAPVRKLPGGGPAPRQASPHAPGHEHGAPGMTGDMLERRPDGRWTSHLLPFAPPFPDKASLQAALARARAQGLIR
jgi:hypothetical protein